MEYPVGKSTQNPKYAISESIILYPNGVAKAQNIPKYPPGYPRGPYLSTLEFLKLTRGRKT
jgi:hypothetical protein